jgi:septum formation protein
MKKIILASGSPRRKQLLEWAGISFEVRVSDSEENFPEDLSPNEVAIHIAENKAVAVQYTLEDTNSNAYAILAADTIVVLNNKIIGKPTSPENAIEILTELSGKTHDVITGVCILQNENKIVFAERTEVSFHELTLSQIEYYVENYQPFDKAGAYAIQEWIGLVGIQSINGDFYNVMGLPVSKLVRELNNL